MDDSLPGSPVPGILQARTLELPFPSPMHESEKWKWSRSVMSDSQSPHGLHGIFQARVLEWGAIAFSTIDAHLGYFHVFTTVTNVAMNIGVQINLHSSDFFSFNYISRDGIDGSYGSSIFRTVLKNLFINT